MLRNVATAQVTTAGEQMGSNLSAFCWASQPALDLSGRTRTCLYILEAYKGENEIMEPLQTLNHRNEVSYYCPLPFVARTARECH